MLGHGNHGRFDAWVAKACENDFVELKQRLVTKFVYQRWIISLTAVNPPPGIHWRNTMAKSINTWGSRKHSMTWYFLYCRFFIPVWFCKTYRIHQPQPYFVWKWNLPWQPRFAFRVGSKTMQSLGRKAWRKRGIFPRSWWWDRISGTDIAICPVRHGNGRFRSTRRHR